MAVPQRIRPLASGPLVALVLVCAGVTGHGAVLPLTNDLPSDTTAGPRAGLLPPSGYGPLAGSWIGHTSNGQDVRFELKITDRGISGVASLPELVSDASTPLAMTSLSLTERVLVFRVRPGPCGVAATYGILTFVSADSARLDLQSAKAPITLLLSKVG